MIDLRLGSCLDPVTGMASLPDGSVDHVICDPPYSEHVHGKQRRGHIAHEPNTGRSTFNRSTDLGFAHITQDQMEAVADQFQRLVRRWVLVFCDDALIHRWRGALESAGMEYIRTGAWVKLDSTPQFTGDRPAPGWEAVVIAHQPGRKRWNGGGQHGVWTCPIVMNRGGNDPRLHTTQKPLALMERLVSLFTDPGELVLDPFCGSGTTGVAARRLGRRFIGWELDPKYHAIATRRIEATREQLSLLGGAA